MTTMKSVLEVKILAAVIISAALLCGCGGNSEEALNADNAEESASDLITFFDGAKPEIKKLAKATSKAIDASNFPLAVQNINLLKDILNLRKIMEQIYLLLNLKETYFSLFYLKTISDY